MAETAQHRNENLMINLEELPEIGLRDPMVWPPWFTWRKGLVPADVGVQA